MINFIKTYLIAGGVYWIIDFIWLALVANKFYQRQLGGLLADNIKWPAAIIFYTLFPIGVIVFAVIPGVNEDSLSKTLLLGALFGFFTYATYDLSNYITLADWPIKVVFVDILWGMLISLLVAFAGFQAANL
jgi:uncharacterized membrane protein